MAAETTAEIGKNLVALCKEGREKEATALYYSEDIVSYEGMNPADPIRGMDALKVKYQWWYDNMTVNKAEVYGPYVNGDQFAVRFVYDITEKATGKPSLIDEIGVYLVRDGKIVEERFFY